ncbi:MAG: hypothetical protein NT033_05095 [Candidatus Omnitrophica bacterium]|nr:hypothetical protein [Candidatus Omnitrophota bacterium]
MTKTYKRLAKSLAQLASLARMYKFEHPMVREKSAGVYTELRAILEESRQSIVLAKSADMLLINGEKIEPESRLMVKFIEDFVALDIGSVELEAGISLEELGIFMHLLSKAECRPPDRARRHLQARTGE